MNHKRPPLPMIIIILLIVAASIYFVVTQSLNNRNGALTASGTIEAVQVNIAPELSGKVMQVLAEEGQSVDEDDALLLLDPSLLTAQRDVAAAQVQTAQAALASAQTQFQQTVQAALVAQGEFQAQDWRFSAPDEFNQPLWYFSNAEQMYIAETEVEAARNALNETLADLATVTKDVDNADFVNAEARLKNAREAFLVAKDVKVQAEYAAESGGLLDAAYDYYNAALDELNAAQREYNQILGSATARTVLDARSQVALAQQLHDVANTRLLVLQTGWNSPAVINAEHVRAQAEKALAQAEANLVLLDTQVAKLTVSAPADGVILNRLVEPGEFVQPGSTVFVLGQLSDLTITVYVPEDRYGEISLSRQAQVTADSFPGVTFGASVIQIADKAEYTPRNVQTVEGRSSTVYAIKLRVSDPDGKLKPGMPADVVFE